LDTTNVGMILTGLNVAQQCKWEELNQAVFKKDIVWDGIKEDMKRFGLS